MNLEPRNTQVIGRLLLKRVLSTIIRPDESKGTTKFVLIDAVGPGAEALGLQVGQVVIPIAMGHISLDGGVSFRPILEEKNVAAVVRDAPMSDFVIQTDNANQYVALDDPSAAAPFLGTRGDETAEKAA